MSDEPELPGEPDPIILRRLAESLELLPRLTRAVFLLHRSDGLSYEEIGWRCGITVGEVMQRMVYALSTLRRHCDGEHVPLGWIRQALLPWRHAWYRWRRRCADRSLGL
jgi:DNA-directed RNA polymerase specialized sigma24 family protein